MRRAQHSQDGVLRTRRFRFVSAEESASALPWRDQKAVIGELDGRVESVVLDTIDNVEGMEFLLAIALGMERRMGTNADGPFSEPNHVSRSRIYRALTRTQLYFILVNELFPGGWLGHLSRVKQSNEPFDENIESYSVARGQARQAMVKHDESEHTTNDEEKEKDEKDMHKEDTEHEVLPRQVTDMGFSDFGGSIVAGSEGARGGLFA